MTTATRIPTRYVRLSHGVTVRVGSMAGTHYLHNHAPDGGTGTSCLACFGWVTDPRHTFHQVLPAGRA